MKNECGKTRGRDNPYEIWVCGEWEWRVLKKYQSPDNEAKNPYAKWFCAVKSPMTYGSFNLGDVYIKDITNIPGIRQVTGPSDMRSVMRHEVNKQNAF